MNNCYKSKYLRLRDGFIRDQLAGKGNPSVRDWVLGELKKKYHNPESDCIFKHDGANAFAQFVPQKNDHGIVISVYKNGQEVSQVFGTTVQSVDRFFFWNHRTFNFEQLCEQFESEDSISKIVGLMFG